MSGAATLAAAAVAALGASVAHRLLTRRVTASRWERINHAGDPVTLLEGPAYVAGAALGAAASGPAGVVATLGSGAFGALDDLAGDGASKGLRGHLGAAAQGRVTTGLVKMLGIGATGLVAAALADRRRDDVGAVDTLVGGAVVAAPANLVNLLDLRPGRALKVTVLSPPRCCWAAARPGADRRAAAAGAALGVLAPTSRAPPCSATPAPTPRGPSSAARCSTRTGRRGRLVALVVLAALTLASEKVSFTRVIESTPGLRELDAWGRPGAMTRRRFASGIAGAAGLIAVTTLFARTAGFARILVFADAVRAGGVGGIYQSVNAMPNVLFEVAAGGILAAVAVPLIASRLGAGERDRAEHTASVLLAWTLALLLPVAGLLWLLAAHDLVEALVIEGDPQARTSAATLLRIFAVQVPLYGLGIILTGLLQAHRRFLAAALAPLASSIVVLASYLWYGSIVERPDRAVAGERRGDPGARLGHHARCGRAVGAAGRAGDAHRLALAARRCGCRRTTPGGSAPSPRPASSPCSPSRAPCSSRSGSPSSPATAGRSPSTSTPRPSTCCPTPCSPCPVATSAFPALAARSGAGEDVTAHPVARPARRARADRPVGGRAHRRRTGDRGLLLAARRPPRRRRRQHRRPSPHCPRRSPPTPRAWSASASPRC